MRWSALVFATLLAAPAAAHFVVLIPSQSVIAPGDAPDVTVTVAFAHPFAREGMAMDRPARVAAASADGTTDLTGALAPAEHLGAPAWRLAHRLARPGAQALHVAQQPYWEPAEGRFIIHHAKAYVALGDDAGWDAPLGLPVEIAPLSSPLRLYAGALFRGRILRDGAPLPFATVEVEHLNETGIVAPHRLLHAQTLRADADGVVSFVAPGPGWWGLAALTEADWTLAHDGVARPVEVGGVLWLRFEPWDAR